MSKIVKEARTPKEKLYGLATLLLGPPLWVLLFLGALGALANPTTAPVVGVYITYPILFGLFYLISSAAYRATAYGNMVLLSPQQLPHLHQMVEEGARELGMDPPPRTFLFNSNGLLNAYARRLLGGRYVFLTSALVDLQDDEEVRFVIGHELGHHAAGHLRFLPNLLRLPSYAVPFLMPAYSRSREYTCDQIGARLAHNTKVSQSALLMLGCGCARVKTSLNCEAFMAQETKVPKIFGFLTEICRSHPRMTRRLTALRQRS